MLKVQAEKLGGCAILHFQGPIVRGEETQVLRQAVHSQENANAVILDFAEVDLIDAGGLGTLVELRDWTQSRGIEFRLLNVNGLVHQVLEITRLNTVFEIGLGENERPQVACGRPSALAIKTPAMRFGS